MAEVIRMPRLSDTMEEGVIVEWLKQVGDKVEPGDVLAEVETDKATMELENFQDGYLLYIGVEKGTVPVNGILAVIGEKNEDYKLALSEAQTNGNAEKSEADSTAISDSETPKTAQEDSPAEVVQPETIEQTDSGKRIKASPLAKTIAQQAGISLRSVQGTGDGGRVVKKDVENFISTKSAPTPVVETPIDIPDIPRPSNQEIAFGDHPVSQMRKTIARRLGESKFTAPHFYLTIEMDMTQTFEERKKINGILSTRISFNDLVIKAAAMSLRKHPKINSSWFGDKITVHKDIHIGVAVAVEEGLLVPVIEHADYKSLSQLNTEVKELAGRAKEKKLQLEEMQGNTFTISNLGMFGIEEFTAIINPPDACILAVGGIFDKPVVKDGTVVPGKVMKVTLSCDHRVVDGATGARFLQTFKMMLENPISMLV
jgi:pyruvate dehydrogenase E2 component (dihydrolipoamide acetyltransferase)